MDVKQIRRLNIKYLADVKHTRSGLATKLRYDDTNYINQLCGNFGSFGNATARKIEKALKLAHGWMDNLHPELYLDKIDRREWPLETDQQYIDFFVSMSTKEKAETIASIIKKRTAQDAQK